MKHFSFAFLFTALLLSACQNSDTAAKSGQNAATSPASDAPIPKVDVPQFEQALVDAKATADDTEKLLKSMYDAPASAKKKHSVELERLRGSLSDILGKQQHVIAEAEQTLKAVDAASKNGTPFQPTDSQQIKGYIDRFERTKTEIPKYQAEIKKLTEDQ